LFWNEKSRLSGFVSLPGLKKPPGVRWSGTGKRAAYSAIRPKGQGRGKEAQGRDRETTRQAAREGKADLLHARGRQQHPTVPRHVAIIISEASNPRRAGKFGFQRRDTGLE